eukprot:TRINITY_DN5733_c0_g1_i5.p1 TRINITY_DN5733_c0_g1~~TRINITY_DN5733_c0_g1_i5.p1  ORF type:complete len:209 (+),score=32.56 TRINITY_DN5733_c0_g1_i5:193-819(+)
MLIKQFGSGLRVRRLRGMWLEANGDFQKADEVYTSILKEDPTNMMAWKRKIALLKAGSPPPVVISELNNYLEIFQTDDSAWQELANLYVQQQKYDYAKFCFEELLTAAPENYLYHLQYAEVLYTIGGRNNVELARQYYAQSLQLNPQNNLRALYGICLCMKALGNAKPVRQQEARVADSLHNQCVERLTQLYREQSPSLLPYLKSIIQ